MRKRKADAKIDKADEESPNKKAKEDRKEDKKSAASSKAKDGKKPVKNKSQDHTPKKNHTHKLGNSSPTPQKKAVDSKEKPIDESVITRVPALRPKDERVIARAPALRLKDEKEETATDLSKTHILKKDGKWLKLNKSKQLEKNKLKEKDASPGILNIIPDAVLASVDSQNLYDSESLSGTPSGTPKFSQPDLGRVDSGTKTPTIETFMSLSESSPSESALSADKRSNRKPLKPSALRLPPSSAPRSTLFSPKAGPSSKPKAPTFPSASASSITSLIIDPLSEPATDSDSNKSDTDKNTTAELSQSKSKGGKTNTRSALSDADSVVSKLPFSPTWKSGPKSKSKHKSTPKKDAPEADQETQSSQSLTS